VHFELSDASHRAVDYRYPLALAWLCRRIADQPAGSRARASRRYPTLVARLLQQTHGGGVRRSKTVRISTRRFVGASQLAWSTVASKINTASTAAPSVAAAHAQSDKDAVQTVAPRAPRTVVPETSCNDPRRQTDSLGGATGNSSEVLLIIVPLSLLAANRPGWLKGDLGGPHCANRRPSTSASVIAIWGGNVTLITI
jgi:hypothetical protein